MMKYSKGSIIEIDRCGFLMKGQIIKHPSFSKKGSSQFASDNGIMEADNYFAY